MYFLSWVQPTITEVRVNLKLINHSVTQALIYNKDDPTHLKGPL